MFLLQRRGKKETATGLRKSKRSGVEKNETAGAKDCFSAVGPQGHAAEICKPLWTEQLV